MLFIANSIMFCNQVMVLHVPEERKYNHSIIDCHKLQQDHHQSLYATRCCVGHEQKDIDGAVTNHKRRFACTCIFSVSLL